MGDRGQILIKDSGVYLYTHWDGCRLQEILEKALKRGKERWDDPEYLTRIIFCQMLIEGDDVGGLTGYGIGRGMHGDLDNDLIEINCMDKTVKIGDVIQPFSTYRKLEGSG